MKSKQPYMPPYRTRQCEIWRATFNFASMDNAERRPSHQAGVVTITTRTWFSEMREGEFNDRTRQYEQWSLLQLVSI